MTAIKKSEVNNKKYELVAPDGGWGYMICAAAVIVFVAIVTFLPCFGLLYNDVLKEMNVESTGVTALNGITAMSLAVGGYLSSPLLKIMSLRKLSLIGAILYNCGVFFLLFTNSAAPFFICLGVLQGTGMGILYNLTFTILNQFFDKKRLFAFSIIQALIATFAIFGPQIVQLSLSAYGYRGTILVVTAVGLQAFVGIALFQPIKWHMKKVELPLENELEVLLLKEKHDTTIPIVKLSDVEQMEDEKSHEKTYIEINDGEKSVLKKVLNDLFDLKIIKLVLMSMAAWIVALSMFADSTFTLIMPQALYVAQWNENDVAMALSLAGFGDLATRGLFIILSNFLNKISNQQLFIIGLFVSTIGKLGMLISTNIFVVYVFVLFIGVGRCFLALLMPLVLSDVCPEKFTMVMGISLIFMGLVNLGLGPVVGAVRDLTDSYVITFYVLTGITCACMVLWSVVLIYKCKKRKNDIINKSIEK